MSIWSPFLQTNFPWPEPSTHRHQVHEFQRSHIGRHWCSWRPRLSHVRWNPSGCSSFIYPSLLVKVSLKKNQVSNHLESTYTNFLLTKISKIPGPSFHGQGFFSMKSLSRKIPFKSNRPPFDLLKFDPTTSTGGSGETHIVLHQVSLVSMLKKPGMNIKLGWTTQLLEVPLINMERNSCTQQTLRMMETGNLELIKRFIAGYKFETGLKLPPSQETASNITRENRCT